MLRTMVFKRIVFTLAVFLAACSSDPSYELSVDLRTDYVQGEDFDTIVLSIDTSPIAEGAEESAETTVTEGALVAADYVGGVRIADVDGMSPGRKHLLLRLQLAGATVASTKALVEFDESRVLTMVVSRSCAGVECPGTDDPTEATSCLGGVCVDPECDPDDPMSCGVGECVADADCPDRVACLRAVCVGGACLDDRDDDACGGGVCSASGTCVGAPADGGREDLGSAPRDLGGSSDPDLGPADMGPPDLGLSDTFCPTTPTTRGEFARFAVRYMHPGFDPAAWTYRGTFSDVPRTAPFAAEIERFAADGITSGCEAGRFCPGDPVLRWQAAVFLTRIWRGVSFTPPDIAGIYTDVPDAAGHHDFVEYMRTTGIMNGCGATTFCPADNLTRLQSAVVFVRLADGPSPSLPPYVGYFSDVPAGYSFARHIERFAVLGYTNGC